MRQAAGVAALLALVVLAVVLVRMRDSEAPPRERGLAPIEPRDPRAPLSWTSSRDVVKVRNADGVWWIYRRCFDRTVRGRRWSVGPGYVARFRDRLGRLLVDDYRPRRDLWSPGYLNAVNGGLGTFGFHYARGEPAKTPAGDDPTTRAVERGVGRPYPGYSIEGRMCARTNRGFGVSTVDAHGPVRRGGAVLYVSDVALTDGRADPLMRVRYQYRFKRRRVTMVVAVTTYPAPKVFVKEPKLVATLRGGGYRRMAIFGSDFQKGVLEGAPEGTPVLSTGHAADPTRRRVRWDYGRSASANDPNACAPAPCFDVIVGATNGIAWENGHAGFDGWAVASAMRAQTWPRDTKGAEVAWDCPSSPDLDGVRRWEFGGWKARNPSDPVNNPHPYSAAEASFIGWEGGRGPRDCEPLERALAPVRETWGAVLTFAVSDFRGQVSR
jgi:hypothetical protein